MSGCDDSRGVHVMSSYSGFADMRDVALHVTISHFLSDDKYCV